MKSFNNISLGLVDSSSYKVIFTDMPEKRTLFFAKQVQGGTKVTDVHGGVVTMPHNQYAFSVRGEKASSGAAGLPVFFRDIQAIAEKMFKTL